MVIPQISRIRDKAAAFVSRELAGRHMKGIAPSHGDILGLLYVYGDLPMKKLAEHIHRDKSMVTALVAKLARIGYVKKEVPASDLRSSIVSLTEKGAAMQGDFWEVSDALRKRAYQGLTQEDRKTLTRLLNRIEENPQKIFFAI